MRKFIVKKSGLMYEDKTFLFKKSFDKPAKIKKVEKNKQNKNSTENK